MTNPLRKLFCRPAGTCSIETVLSEIREIQQQIGIIMGNQTDAAASLNQVRDQLAKVATETSTLLTKIEELKTAVTTAGQITPELQAAIDGVADQAKKVDDLVPDATPQGSAPIAADGTTGAPQV